MSNKFSLPKRKFRIKTDTVIASSAVFISLCALVISISENRLMRQQQKVAVYPHLDIDFNYNQEGFSLLVENKGQGLAFVDNMEVWADDKYFQNWIETADYFLPKGHQINYSICKFGVINNEILSPDEQVLLFHVPWNEETRVFVEEYIPKLNFNICYSSIMGESWHITKDSKRPIEGKCKSVGLKQFY